MTKRELYARARACGDTATEAYRWATENQGRTDAQIREAAWAAMTPTITAYAQGLFECVKAQVPISRLLFGDKQ